MQQSGVDGSWSLQFESLSSQSHTLMFAYVHEPVLPSHVPDTHFAPESQFFFVPAHLPEVQTSPVVQRSASSHVLPSRYLCAQPILLTHTSSVQTFESSQESGFPVQAPSLQASPVVQGSPSSHDLAFDLNRHPAAGSH